MRLYSPMQNDILFGIVSDSDGNDDGDGDDSVDSKSNHNFHFMRLGCDRQRHH